MAHFRNTTQGHTVVMGRKTLESFPSKKPLPNRRNIVLTKNEDYRVNGAEVVHSVEELLNSIKAETDDVYIIGGAQIYAKLLPIAIGKY